MFHDIMEQSNNSYSKINVVLLLFLVLLSQYFKILKLFS